MQTFNYDTGKVLALSPALYGLRGLAALIVVLSHASKKGMFLVPGLDFSGTGKLGVWLFFVLSAYTLTHQFMQWEYLGLGSRFRIFLFRRAFRIFPLFWFALLLDFFLGRINSEHVSNAFLLLSAPNHFWTVPVEFQFYFLIPLLAMAWIRIMPMARPLLVCTLIAVAVITCCIVMPLAVWRFLPCFLSGVGLAYWAYKHPVHNISLPYVRAWVIVAVVVSALATPAVIRAIELAPVLDVDYLRNHSTLFGLLFTGCVIAASILPTFRCVLGSRMAVWLGGLSYSVYLLHPLVLDAAVELDVGPWGAWPVLVGVVLIGYLGFVSIERPARNLGYQLTCGVDNDVKYEK